MIIILLISLFLFAAECQSANTSAPVIFDIKTIENAKDGAERWGCRLQTQAAQGEDVNHWLTIGRIESNAEAKWQPASSRTDCGKGTYSSTGSKETAGFGIPYLVVDISATRSSEKSNQGKSSLIIDIQKFDGFTDAGKPRYKSTKQEAGMAIAAGDRAIFPLFMADDEEIKSFGIQEAMLQLRIRDMSDYETASYGSLSIVADIPGAEILLDGGYAGRTTDKEPMILRNVLSGRREVTIRDFSGREKSTSVTVNKGENVAVDISVLDLKPGDKKEGLLAIGKNPQGYEEYFRTKDKAIVVEVPAGEFIMGSKEGEGEANERPQRKVHVSGFLMDKTEVTWRQFKAFSDATGYTLPEEPLWGRPDDYAVTGIKWDDAKSYCDWVGANLPTEAQWEKAARGTDGRTYMWGDRFIYGKCNGWQGGPHRPYSVGIFSECVSPFGLLEMPGGVREWCSDWYTEDQEYGMQSKDPAGPETGSSRVIRGGTWVSQGNLMRPAYRYRALPSSVFIHNGFRCAHSSSPMPAAESPQDPRGVNSE